RRAGERDASSARSACVARHQRSGWISAQPGSGLSCTHGALASASTAPRASTIAARTPVVPMSIPRRRGAAMPRGYISPAGARAATGARRSGAEHVVDAGLERGLGHALGRGELLEEQALGL